MHTCISSHGLKRSWRSCPRRVNAGNKNTLSTHHPRRRNVTTLMVGLKNGHIRKNLTQRYSWGTQKKKKKKQSTNNTTNTTSITTSSTPITTKIKQGIVDHLVSLMVCSNGRRAGISRRLKLWSNPSPGPDAQRTHLLTSTHQHMQNTQGTQGQGLHTVSILRTLLQQHLQRACQGFQWAPCLAAARLAGRNVGAGWGHLTTAQNINVVFQVVIQHREKKKGPTRLVWSRSCWFRGWMTRVVCLGFTDQVSQSLQSEAKVFTFYHWFGCWWLGWLSCTDSWGWCPPAPVTTTKRNSAWKWNACVKGWNQWLLWEKRFFTVQCHIVIHCTLKH